MPLFAVAICYVSFTTCQNINIVILFCQIEAEVTAVRDVAQGLCPLKIVLDRVVLTSTGVLLGCWQVCATVSSCCSLFRLSFAFMAEEITNCRRLFEKLLNWTNMTGCNVSFIFVGGRWNRSHHHSI